MGRLTTRQLARKRGGTKLNTRTELQPGDILQDRYRIVGMLGVGGFSSVYQARDMRFPDVTKLCAIKEMMISTTEPQLRQLAVKSFEREASLLAMLKHRAIPDVTDYFTESNRSYLVMELIRGKDLQDLLDERLEPFSPEEALEWGLQLCDALSYLHEQTPQPIVFRDLKPSNLMLDHNKKIRLIDFGIAKSFEGGRKGTMIGTEGYSPPEQYRGEATPAGDVYAFGATFHHLLTGQDPRLEAPFTFSERPIREVNSAVSASFESLVMRCLSYDPKDRFPHAMALRDALLLLKQPAPSSNGIAVPHATPQATSSTATPARAATPAKPAGIQPLWTFVCEDEIRRKAAVSHGTVFVGAYDNNLYAVSSNEGKFRWKFPASDGFGSSPYVYEDDVYIGSVDEHLYSLKIKNGRMNWRFPTKGPIYSSPMVKFDHVFFGSDDGHFYAVNVKRGQQLWKANAYGPVRSSPYVADEKVFFGTEGGYAFALNMTTGKLVWQFQAKRGILSSPFVIEDMAIFGSLDYQVYAVDATSGWSIWSYRTSRPVVSSPTVNLDLGMVYVGSADGNLYALDIDTGRQRWAYNTDGQVTSSPAIWNDAVYFGSTDGYVYSLDLKKGKLRWRYKTNGLVIASPVIADDVVYIGATDNTLYALPA